jgi:hypothetical protein
MRWVLLLIVMLSTGCTVSQWYPLGGAVAGGTVGALGGPVSAGAGAGLGYAAGELAKGSGELKQAQETIQALTEGDMKKILETTMGDQQTGLAGFMDDLKKLLTVVGGLLLVYLSIPFFYTKHCLKKQKRDMEEALTRAPFPVKPPPRS